MSRDIHVGIAHLERLNPLFGQAIAEGYLAQSHVTGLLIEDRIAAPDVMFVQLVGVSEDRILAVGVVFAPHFFHFRDEIKLPLILSHRASFEVIVDGVAQSIVATCIQRQVFISECGRPSACYAGSFVADYLAIERVDDAIAIDIFPANITGFDGFPTG